MKQHLLAKYKKSPSFTFRAKLSNHSQTKNNQENPSPNTYNPQKPMRSPAKIVFPKSSRKTYFDSNRKNFPGPGQYDSHKLTQRSITSTKSDSKFQTCSSRFFQNIEENPGPGTYEIKNDFKKTLPSFSIRKKTQTYHQIQLKNNSFKQDPGAYEIQPKLFRDSSIISIPKSSRQIKVKNDYSPGPGRYEINNSFYSQKSFGKSNFPGSMRQTTKKVTNETPGPIYNIESSFETNKRKQRGFSCRIKFNKQNLQNQDLPGPGEYHSQKIFKFKSTLICKMPKAERRSLNDLSSSQQKLPGPGKYGDLTKSYEKLNFKSQSAPKFSKAKLENIYSSTKINSTDNFYDPKFSIIKKSASSFSIGSSKRQQFIHSDMRNMPGPGQYNPENRITKQKVLAPKFAQSKRINPILNKLKVGPGEYFNEKASSSLSRTGIKFSKEQRMTNFNTVSELKNKSALRLMNIISSHGEGMKTQKKG